MSQEQRAAVVTEAMTWLDTPFHHHARIKGAGVDCVNLLIGVFSACELVPEMLLDHYPPDWNLHNNDALFLTGVAQHADRLPEGDVPLPGDVVMFKYGLHAAHGAIVTEWPVVIHAWRDAGKVVLSEANTGPLGNRIDSIWRLRSLA